MTRKEKFGLILVIAFAPAFLLKFSSLIEALFFFGMFIIGCWLFL